MFIYIIHLIHSISSTAWNYAFRYTSTIVTMQCQKIPFSVNQVWRDGWTIMIFTVLVTIFNSKWSLNNFQNQLFIRFIQQNRIYKILVILHVIFIRSCIFIRTIILTKTTQCYKFSSLIKFPPTIQKLCIPPWTDKPRMILSNFKSQAR